MFKNSKDMLFRHSDCGGMRGRFTLIELLVVIAVIAILAALLMPSLNKARMTAQRMACMGNLKQIGVSVFIYADDHKGEGPSGLDGQRGMGFGELGNYSPNIRKTRCPGIPAKYVTLQYTGIKGINSYTGLFGSASWLLTNSYNWYGFSKDVTSPAYSSVAILPNIRFLGRTHTYVTQAGNSVNGTLAIPSEQPIGGDTGAGGKNTFYVYPNTVYFELHGDSRNTLFADGHVNNRAWAACNRKIYIYALTLFYGL